MKVEKVIKALADVVDSAEDEGCDGCFTVSAESIERAKKLLNKYYEEVE